MGKDTGEEDVHCREFWRIAGNSDGRLPAKRLPVHIAGTFTVAVGGAASCKVDVTETRNKAYADFCRNYDSM